MSNELKKGTPLKSLNAPIYKWGLSPMQFAVIIIITGLSFLINIYFAFIFILVIYFISKKIAKENSNGNPDYLGSLLRSSGKTDYYEDKRKLMNLIINDDE
jgi:hypothetical protein